MHLEFDFLKKQSELLIVIEISAAMANIRDAIVSAILSIDEHI